jgi:hypothetical protein
MAYSKKAAALRQCTAITKVGKPYQAWALWDDPRQLCCQHAGRGHKGPMKNEYKRSRPARYTPCTCVAYAWPHRPGSGLCRWPDPPQYRLMTPQGIKDSTRGLISLGRQLQWAKEEREFMESLRTDVDEPHLQHEEDDTYAAEDAGTLAGRQEESEERVHAHVKERYGESLAELELELMKEREGGAGGF